MTDQTNTEVLTPDVVDTNNPMMAAAAQAAAMLGIDLDALMATDPDAATLDEVVEALDDLTAEIRTLAAALAPVIALAVGVKANESKLRKFGISF